ncbi:iron ABC transporter permease [Amycolatopsis sp. FDAARGOS 1241]|uniref:ABC transporter permease n=1 Tax=Amycolatopsis sp. FDAARGOS 1241 TaxID=2778070 RepID=UPI00195244F6|nr:ABC transporter permease subunit [Amycolatopsis sp. FDAARGOS 1241]QRP47904.1 ABC transporter permease subunit [Amycolatopsis sp. FDAARGOS 1241]
MTITTAKYAPRIERKRGRTDGLRITGALLALGYAALLVYTIGGTVISLLSGKGAQSLLARTFAVRGLGDALLNSVIILVTAVPLALLVATLFAWLNERTDASLGWVSRLLPLVPFLLPPIALAIGWMFLGSSSAGYLNSIARSVQQALGLPQTPIFEIGSWPGLVFVYTLHLVPFAYLIIAAALRNVDGSQEESSRMSGARVIRTLFRVYIPAIAPAIASAALLCVVTSFALYSVPSIIGVRARIRVLPVVIIELVRGTYPPQLDVAVVLSVLIALVVATMFWLERRISRRGRHAVLGGKGARPSPVRLGAWKWPARCTVLLYLLLSAVLPVIALLLVSLSRSGHRRSRGAS